MLPFCVRVASLTFVAGFAHRSSFVERRTTAQSSNAERRTVPTA
jgi:hypothetical protein